MTQTLTTPKLSPTDRRYAFVKSCIDPINEHILLVSALKGTGLPLPAEPTLDELKAIANRMTTEGPALGRTAHWKATCDFACREISEAAEAGKLDASFARWAILQGSVYMGYAA